MPADGHRDHQDQGAAPRCAPRPGRRDRGDWRGDASVEERFGEQAMSGLDEMSTAMKPLRVSLELAAKRRALE